MPLPDESFRASLADDQLRRIESVTDTALAHLDVEDLLLELLERVQALLGVDTAAVLLLNASAEYLVATAARGIEAEVRQGVRIPVGKGFAGRIAAAKKPVILDRVDHTTVLNPILQQRGIRSLLGVPLLTRSGVLGVLHVGSLGTRRFSDEDARLLEIVADRVAVAIESRRAEVERTAARVLQRSLLPARLPTVPGLELAARYVTAELGGVGGDWYDVFDTPSGGLCIVIGDVVGRGLEAAAVMGRLRSALRAHALYTDDPAEVVARLSHQVWRFDGPKMVATVQVAMLEASLTRLHLASAGHLAPVLVSPDQPPTLVKVANGPPLGVASGRQRRVTTVELPPGGVLCFYTDGLVERRRSSLDEGQQRLCAAVVAGPVESVCARVMRKLIGDDPPGDDVALLVMRRQGGVDNAPLELMIPAQPESLKSIRDAMRGWLVAVGAQPREVVDLLLAVGEACANIVEHAYGPQGGLLEVLLELQSPDVVATVRDTGRWRLPRGGNRGRGTVFMHKCASDVRIDHGPGGTTVVIRRRLVQADTR